MDKNKKSLPADRRGFTLIELLIVIAIIGILSSIILVSISAVRSRARDAKRMAEISSLQPALEMYFNIKGYYPPYGCGDACNGHADEASAELAWNNMLAALKTEKIISDSFLQNLNDANSEKIGLLDKIGNFILNKALAAATLQDPLYDDTYNIADGTFPYRYEYTVGHISAKGDNQSYRLRVKLENPGMAQKYTSYKGNFYWSTASDDTIEEWGSTWPSAFCYPEVGYVCYGPANKFNTFVPGKPVIYLYPTQKQDIAVQVAPKRLLKTEPEYGENGWKVSVDPSGNIFNYADGKNYPYLFWEAQSNQPKMDRTKGFVVKKEEINSFLAEKLKTLGLNQKEIADYIEFWGPKMQKKAYTYIYFMPQVDFDELAPLTVNPKPDSIIRVYTLYKSLDQPIEVTPQELKTPERKGFTVVEWGGDLMEVK